MLQSDDWQTFSRRLMRLFTRIDLTGNSAPDDARCTPRLTASPIWLLLGVLIVTQVLFIWTMLNPPWVTCGTVALLLSGIFLISRGQDALSRYSARSVFACAVVATTLCILGGQGHLLHATEDWQIRDAVLSDLSHSQWPITYQVGSQQFILRAPLGFYLLPSFISYTGNIVWTHELLLLQDAVLLTAIFLAFSEYQPVRSGLITIGVFTLFSGWDIVGGMVLPVAPGVPKLAAIAPETWARGLQYSSHMTDLFWAPNHTLPAWIMLAGYVCWRRNKCSAVLLAALSGLCLLWSPLAGIGAAPFIGLALIADWRSGQIRRGETFGLSLMAVAILPTAIYLTRGAERVVHQWNFKTLEFQSYYCIFLAFEVLPLLYLASRARSLRQGLGAIEFGLLTFLLFAFPLYKVGFANDFMMRGSIFPIGLAGLLAAEGFVEGVEAQRWRAMLAPTIVLLIGAATPVMDVVVALATPRNPPKATDLPHAWAASPYKNQDIERYLVKREVYEKWSWLLCKPR